MMPIPSEVVVCRACGTQNRIRTDLHNAQFRCGSCHAPIEGFSRQDRAANAIPKTFFRFAQCLLEIAIFAIPIWVAYDSLAHPKREPDKSTVPYSTGTPHPQLQPVRSLEELRAEAIAALPAPTPPPFTEPEEPLP